MSKVSFTETGQGGHLVVTERSTARYFARFGAGATGTVQLEMKINDEWLPADSAVSETMEIVKVSDARSSVTTEYRWNCIAVSDGSIECFLA